MAHGSYWKYGIVVLAIIICYGTVLPWQPLFPSFRFFFFFFFIHPRQITTSLTINSNRTISSTTNPKDVTSSSSSSSSSSLLSLEDRMCLWLPKDKTTSYIWNQELYHHHIQKQWFVQEKNLNDFKEWDRIMMMLSNYEFNAFRLLRGVSQLPLYHTWRQLWWNMESITTIVTSTSHPPPLYRPIQVWMIVNPMDTCHETNVHCNTTTTTTWIQLLKDIATHYCPNWLQIEWTVLDWTFATTPFYTDILRAQRGKLHGPDFILHALSRHDLFHTNLENKNPNTVLWEEERRSILQNFVRATRRSCPCHDTVLVFVDDYIPTQQQQSTEESLLSLWVQEVNSRMLQQISEYYRTGLLSYSAVIKEWMKILMMMKTTKEFTTNTIPISILTPDNSGTYQPMAHITLAHIILYGLLHFQVTFCNTKDHPFQKDDIDSLLLSTDLMNRVSTVLPPFLDAQQTLLTVSEEWIQQEQMDQQYYQNNCNHKSNNAPRPSPPPPQQEQEQQPTLPNECLADFYWGQSLSTLGNGEHPMGWIRTSDGFLRWNTSSQLKWSLDKNETSQYEGGSATIYVLLKNREEITITWTVVSKNSMVSGNSTIDDHSRSSKIAIPIKIQLPDQIEDELVLQLSTTHSDMIDIVGFFLCEKENIQRVSH